MKKYRLKKGQESFQVVDGPYAGKQYARGKTYDDIPPQEKKRFEEIKPAKPAQPAKPEKE